jgi:hypothetical protein
MISEFRKSDSPVHFQSFKVSALYLDQMTTILLRANQATKIISLALKSNGRDLCFVLITFLCTHSLLSGHWSDGLDLIP